MYIKLEEKFEYFSIFLSIKYFTIHDFDSSNTDYHFNLEKSSYQLNEFLFIYSFIDLTTSQIFDTFIEMN